MSNCIFCKIIAGEIPSATVYEDEEFKAIMDINPAAKGHIILVPKKHSTNLLDVEDDIASKALLVARQLVNAMQKELSCDGINLLQNNGEVAGQTVFHLHFHLIPRYQEDVVRITWEHGTYAEGEAAELATKIAAHLKDK